MTRRINARHAFEAESRMRTRQLELLQQIEALLKRHGKRACHKVVSEGTLPWGDRIRPRLWWWWRGRGRLCRQQVMRWYVACLFLTFLVFLSVCRAPGCVIPVYTPSPGVSYINQNALTHTVFFPKKYRKAPCVYLQRNTKAFIPHRYKLTRVTTTYFTVEVQRLAAWTDEQALSLTWNAVGNL